jgi:glycosyltransferase involved in cell wall biosynthesis
VLCITNFLPQDKLDGLHSIGDIFVSTSHGEAWGIPAHDALGFGNPVILGKWGAYPELMCNNAASKWIPETNQFAGQLDVECGWLIDGQLSPCFGHTDSFPDLYTGSELWFEPNLSQLISSMREAYHQWTDNQLEDKRQSAQKRALVFSYDNVGQIAKQLLDQ